MTKEIKLIENLIRNEKAALSLLNASVSCGSVHRDRIEIPESIKGIVTDAQKEPETLMEKLGCLTLTDI